MLTHIIFKRYFPRPFQQRHAECDELFGSGANIENGFGSNRDSMLQACHAVAARIQDFSPAQDSNREPRSIFTVPLGEQFANFANDIFVHLSGGQFPASALFNIFSVVNNSRYQHGTKHARQGVLRPHLRGGDPRKCGHLSECAA